jgi:threonine 3-dehydrogenase
VAAASICGTDRELVSYTTAAKAFGLRLPVTLGHEVAGTVVETGAAVTRIRPGDRVALESHIACGDCYHCRVGQGHNCLRMQLLGLHVDGGFAERTVSLNRPATGCRIACPSRSELSLSPPAWQCIPCCAASTPWQANR